jgi:hypothetical protein
MSGDPLKSNALPFDRMHLSPASHSLVDGTEGANRVPEGAVSPERMLAVLRRLQQDYYSSAEVHDKVAHAVRRDLGLEDGVVTP